MKIYKKMAPILLLGMLSFTNASAQSAQSPNVASEGSGHSGGGGNYKSDTLTEVCGTPSIDENNGDLLSATSINQSCSFGICNTTLPTYDSKIMINGVQIDSGGNTGDVNFLRVARTAIRLHKDLCFRTFYKDLGWGGMNHPGFQWRAGQELYVKP